MLLFVMKDPILRTMLGDEERTGNISITFEPQKSRTSFDFIGAFAYLETYDIKKPPTLGGFVESCKAPFVLEGLPLSHGDQIDLRVGEILLRSIKHETPWFEVRDEFIQLRNLMILKEG